MTHLASLAEIAMRAVTRVWPNQIAHRMAGPDDARDVDPRHLHPAFYGSFDWHSAVHGHWTLVRALRGGLDGARAERARYILADHLRAEHLEVELRYLEVPGRAGFERPYGLAWLLQLDADVRQWRAECDDALAATLEAALEPLVGCAVERFSSWLPKLMHPVRSGTHDQTAFALGLVHDWTVVSGHAGLGELVAERAHTWFDDDHDAPIHWEPSGQDFLSPTLAEADLMARLLGPDPLAGWLARLVPGLLDDAWPEVIARWLTPVRCSDPTDGRLAHLDGLNLSRAWMLEAIATALPAAHGPALRQAAERHLAAGLEPTLDAHHWAGSHWLASFACFAGTRVLAPGRRPSCERSEHGA